MSISVREPGRLLAAVLLALLVSAGVARAATEAIEDLLFDLQLVPLDGQAPPAFALDGLDGKRMSLGDFKGQALLLYFWATW